MASFRDEQQIEFRGICLSEPFRDQEIEGRINLSQTDSLRFTQKSNSDYRDSKSDYNRSSSKQNHNYREDRGGSNYREERGGSYQGGKSSRDRGRRRDENAGDRMQLLIVLFGLIFFVNLVAGQLMTNSSSSDYERFEPNYEFNRN